MAAKGYDDSPPRNGIIFFYTVLTVFVLIGVKFLLDSYFASMMGAELHAKVYSRGMEQVAAVRQKEAAALEKGSMPIESAMQLLGQRGRKASPLITPQSGQGAQELAGWSQLKREVKPVAPPPPAAPAPEATPAPAPETAPAPKLKAPAGVAPKAPAGSAPKLPAGAR